MVVEKVSKNKKKVLALGTSVCLLCLAGTLYASAEEMYGAEISIEKPEGWKQGSTSLSIMVDGSHLGEGVSISSIEAKVGDNGSWENITSSRSVTISGNTTVYVRVTDSEGNIYEQNRSIRCYDEELPTLTAALSDGVLTIKGNDSVTGISSITVNGTTYTDLENGTLKIQLTQKDFVTKKIEIYATDTAGNTSEVYSMQNPYYDWAVKQAAQQVQSGQDSSMTTTSPTTPESSKTEEITSPLPQDATPSEPTESKGTVDDRTVTGIEKELAESGEEAESITQTVTPAGKEFYTISTKSGKIFYLIVDNEKQSDNVYFLTEVSEKDLMNFTLSDTVTLPDADTVYATIDKGEPEPTTPSTEAETEETEKVEVQMPEEKSPLGSYLLIGFILAGVGAGAYYFKVYKPKQDGDDEEDELEESEEETIKDDEDLQIKEYPVMEDEEYEDE